MPKLIVTVEGKVVSEWPLGEHDAIIGRGHDCGVQLNDPSVSRHHAKIARIYTGFFIEDLDSTNGVILNGRRVRKHMLKDGDLVQIGTHEIKFLTEGENNSLAEADKTVVLTARPRAVDAATNTAKSPNAPMQKPRKRIAPLPASERQAGKAYVRMLSGPEQGDSKLVDKSLYTIGQPGGNLAVISRRAQGHFLLHLGGDKVTTLNGGDVLGAGVKLNDGDVIQVGDTRLEFFSEP
jgi:pSer/pThr/pTyr-binding forkhead associated (FHA) protein